MSATGTLDSMLEKLNIDEKPVNTILAEKYIKQNNEGFFSLPRKECDPKIYVRSVDAYGNELWCVDGDMIASMTHLYISDILIWNVSKSLLENLSERIVENADLFAQLDFLIRRTPTKEVKLRDINLITQNIMHYADKMEEGVDYVLRRKFTGCGAADPNLAKEMIGVVQMHSNDALATLGLVVQVVSHGGCAIILSEPNVTVVSFLFTQLCRDLGLPVIMMPITTGKKEHIGVIDFSPARGGGVGVLVEDCDVDSALQAFCISSARDPWRLHKIFVQESIYEMFTNTAAALSRVKSSNIVYQMDNLRTQCKAAFVIGDKVFLFDSVADFSELGDLTPHTILVEAYRTTRELLGMINEIGAACLSVWCESMSVAHEISFGADVSTVWLNSTGEFDGPKAGSQGFYSSYDIHYDSSHSEHMVNLRKSWMKLHISKRHNILRSVIEKLNDDDHGNSELLKNILLRSKRMQNNNFVEILDGRLCIGTSRPSDVLVGSVISDENILDVVDSVVSGGGACVYNNGDFKHLNLFKALLKEGMPIVLWQYDATYIMFKKKIVWSNFGTMFAN